MSSRPVHDLLVSRRKGIGERLFASTTPGSYVNVWPGGWSGQRVEQVLHFRHWFYLGERAIMNELASLHPNVARVTTSADPAVRLRRSQSAVFQRRYQKTLHTIRPHEDVEPVGQDHPILRLFDRPNAWDLAGFGQLLGELDMFMSLTGDGFIWTPPNKLGLPCEMWVLPSHWVWPRMGPAGVAGYEIRPLTGMGTLEIPPEEILHLHHTSPLSKMAGWSPMQATSEWNDIAGSIDRSRYFQFKNSVNPQGFLELGPEYHDPDDSQIETIYAKIYQRFQGENRFGGLLIGTPGTKYTPLAFNTMELAWIESANQMRDWVLASLGVPKEILGIQDQGAEIAAYGPMAQFCRFAIRPKLLYYGQILTRAFAHRWDESIRIWWDDPTPDDPAQLNQDIQTDYACQAITPEEIRAIRGRGGYPKGGKNPMAPMGVSPLPWVEDELGDLGLTPAEAANYAPDETGTDNAPEPTDQVEGTPRRPEMPKRAKRQRKDNDPVLLEVPDVRQQEDYSCGAACLEAVCRYLGVGPDDEEGAAGLASTDFEEGTSPEHLEAAGRRLGLDVVADQMTLEDVGDFLRAGSPVICATQQTGEGWTEGHWVVAIGLDAKSVYVQDPVQGKKRIGRKLWERRWHDEGPDGRRYDHWGIALGKTPGRDQAA